MIAVARQIDLRLEMVAILGSGRVIPLTTCSDKQCYLVASTAPIYLCWTYRRIYIGLEYSVGCRVYRFQRCGGLNIRKTHSASLNLKVGVETMQLDGPFRATLLQTCFDATFISGTRHRVQNF